MKPFHNAIFDILKDFEKYSVNNLANLILGNILFCHLENNFNKNRRKIKEDPIKDESNLNFLPPIDNKYIYTLVLDLDETLIHFFYVNIIFYKNIVLKLFLDTFRHKLQAVYSLSDLML